MLIRRKENFRYHNPFNKCSFSYLQTKTQVSSCLNDFLHILVITKGYRCILVKIHQKGEKSCLDFNGLNANFVSYNWLHLKNFFFLNYKRFICDAWITKGNRLIDCILVPKKFPRRDRGRLYQQHDTP